MSDQERVMEDLPAALELLSTLQDQVVGATAYVQNLLQKVRAGAFPTEKGLSFLEMKDQLLLMYLMDIAYLILEKTSGKSLKEHSSILRLVETRTVLEKMRPIDQKLKYQIDKLVKASVTGSLGESDPLRFKPNPDNLISKLSESEEEGENDESSGAKVSGKKNPGKIRKYVPPRLAPMHFDETEAEREHKILERAKKRALSSSVIRELKEQYSEAPEEIREGRGYHMMRQSQEDQRRTSYEESMMVRLNLTRKEKAQKKRSMAMTSQLQSLTHFGDISALMGGTGNPGEEVVPPVKRSKKTLKRGKKKKGFRRWK
uniref:Neuroguidin n=1 Tax=Geotrypetes seraphini TaxID=260995 RepID=A0A6P8RI06_GEOSA|nr:neuroguidin [Geotrypetes seraphini]XP_033802172.1 neuroguidin [Geotrypetes seraphini]XP_033802173.1 neuroguidin [Geotrypetes seraphini]